MIALLTLRNVLIVVAVALTIALGIETDWGSALTATPVTTRSVSAKPDTAQVLPDFRLSSEASTYAQISDRPLLNPTRKPAPTQVVAAPAPEPPKPQIRRGLYQLVGITDLGAVKVAQLRELASNRVKSVREGEPIQEMSVTKIESDTVTLAFMGETDILSLAKYTASGRVVVPQLILPPPPPSPQPVAAAQQRAGSLGADSFPGAAPVAAPMVVPPPAIPGPLAAAPKPEEAAPQLKFPGAGENSPIPGRISVGELLERRRLARANSQ